MEVLQGKLTWLETNTELLEYAPRKSIDNFHLEHELMDFSSKPCCKIDNYGLKNIG